MFSLNRARANALKPATPAPETIRRLIGYEPATGLPQTKALGTLTRPGYRVEKLVIVSDDAIEIPAALYLPADSGPGKTRRAAVVYVDGRGKSAGAAEAESLVRKGLVVLSIDARGLGETRFVRDDNGSDWPRYFGDYDTAMTALLTGSSLTGGRVRDIARAIDVLQSRPEVDAARIFGAARGAGGPAMLHAAVLDKRLRRVALERTLVSFRLVVEHRLHREVFEHVIQGVLRHYDLPDLAGMLGRVPLTVVDAIDPMGVPLGLDRVRAVYPGAAVSRRKANDSAGTLYGFGDQ